MNGFWGIILILFLVLVNAVFVAAEFSLIKVRGTRIAELAQEGSRAARRAQNVLGRVESYLPVIQLGVTMATLGLGWAGEPVVARLVEGPLRWAGVTSSGVLKTVSIVIAFALVTLLTIILGELVPKSVAIRKPEGTTLALSLPLHWFFLLFWPLVWVLNGVTGAILRLFHVEPATAADLAHSEDELRMILSASQEVGHIDEVEQTIMRRALVFGEKTVSDIMVPRTEMAALPTDMSIADALEEVTHSNHTRYPVYEEDMDDTIGYVHVKDLYRADPTNSVRTLIRPIGFISETASIEIALKRFQSTRTPLAIVVDEHGGTGGIVTIQDVVEELIGEMQDEFDHEGPEVEPLEEGGFSVDGGARTDYLEDVIHLEVPQEGFPTLGGRVFEQLQRRPRVGDEVDVGNFHARILEVEGMRIVRVHLMARESAGTPGEAPDKDEDG